MAKNDVKDLVFKSTLKSAYGLPDSWISKLGKPDMKVPNPHHPDGADASLFSVERVEKFIGQNISDYLEMCKKTGKKAYTKNETKQLEKTLSWAREAEIEIDGVPEMRLLEQEVREFYKGKTGDFDASRAAFIEYVRCHYTNYEYLADQLTGKIGKTEAVRILKERVNEEIEVLLEMLAYGVKFKSVGGLVEVI